MIGQAMLYTVTVGVPIFVAALLSAGYLRRHGRMERWVWAVGLVLAFGVPLAMVSRGPIEGEAVATAPETDLLPTMLAAPADAAPFDFAEATTPIDLDPLLLGMWLLASVLLLSRWAISSVRLAALRSGWRSVMLDGVAVLETEGMGPAVAGLLRPRILVPSWVRALPAIERRLVLLHEREHVRAGDHLLVGLCRLARVAAPWNPVVWLLTWGLGRALELDCDRRVLRRQPDVRAYGATLLAISERTSRGWLTAAAFAESDVPLRRRIVAMTTPPRALTALGVLGAVSVGAGLLVGAVSVPAPEVSWTVALQAATAVETAQGSSGALPPLRIVSDPARLIGLVRESGELVTREIGQAGHWRPVGPDGRTGFVPVPYYPNGSWGVLSPLPPDARLQRLAAVPRILNPDEVSEAIDRAYPERLREQGLGGTVGMLFLVERAGVVQQRRIGQVSAYPDLDAAALEVARAYRFSEAATEEGAVPVWVSHAIDFRVD